MDSCESPTPETADRRPLDRRLQGLKRGLDLIGRTRSRDDQRVILGCVFKDLDALRDRATAAAPHLYESFAVIEAGALAWRAKLGAPVAPDEDPETKPVRRRRRKEDPHGAPDRWSPHPDPHDGTPASQAVPQE